MIKNFSDFSDDFIFESLINESILYFSPIFKDKLTRLSDRSEIASMLLNAEGKDLSSDITFIDMSDQIGYLTFLPMDKAMIKIRRFFPNAKDADLNNRYLPDSNTHLYNRDVSDNKRVGIYHSNNNIIKIGKFAKKVIDSIDPNNKFNNSDIEEFVNDLKSITVSTEEFKIVSGDDIKMSYQGTNYLTYAGTLGNSCMTDKNYFKLYTSNPESIRMLILSENNRIVARAIIWKLYKFESNSNITPEYFMDRVYFIKDHYKNMMEKYAIDNGWAYKSTSYSQKDVMIGEEEYAADMVVKIKKGDYSPYPYLDTFCRYDEDNGFLYNDSNSGKSIRGHLLRSTEGGLIKTKFKPSILTKFKDWWNK